MSVWNNWTRLCHVWKTEEAYQVLNLLREEHIQGKTVPDEFNGPLSDWRMLSMDPERQWPVLVQANNMERAITLLKKKDCCPEKRINSHSRRLLPRL